VVAVPGPWVVWIWFGMFVLSYRVGSLAAVAAFVGVAFLFGGGAAMELAFAGAAAAGCGRRR
jgi:hypothetical protein